MLITFEAPGVQLTQVPGAVTYTFNSLTANTTYTNVVAPFGVYDRVFVSPPNSWGGSGQTNYMAVGSQSGWTTTTLTLTSLSSYFGLYWAAGDAQNYLDFYNGNSLVVSISLGTLSSRLTSAYYGNPNNGQDTSEPFAYLNFYGENGVTWNRIVFRNLSTGTGYETDSHAVLAAVQNPPSTPGGSLDVPTIPEPASSLLLAAGLIALGLLRKSRT